MKIQKWWPVSQEEMLSTMTYCTEIETTGEIPLYRNWDDCNKKRWTRTSVGKDVETLELSRTPGGSAKCYGPFEYSLAHHQNADHKVTIEPSSALLGGI